MRSRTCPQRTVRSSFTDHVPPPAAGLRAGAPIWVLVAGLLLCGLVSTPAHAEEPDPFIGQLTEMLEGGVGEKVIKRWLTRQPSLGRPLTADELARLSRAGASDSLLLSLVDASQSAPAPPATVGPVYGSRKIPVLLGDFMLEFGVLRSTDRDTNVRFDLGPSIGTSIRLESLLGFPATSTTFRTAGSYRFKPKQGIEWSYFRFDRSGSKEITETVEILGFEFDVGAAVTSRMDEALLKLAYQHLFVNNGRTAAGMSFGLGVFALDYRVAGEATIGGRPIAQASAGQDILAALPTMGVIVEHAITPRLIFRTKIDFFAFKVLRISDYRGRIFDGSSTLQYFLSRNVSIGGGIAGTSLAVESEGEDAWDVQSDYGGFYGFVGFAFGGARVE